MLFWEAEDPSLGEVHHLTVLCYYLQHPSLYSSEGLEAAKGLLQEFVGGGATPAELRMRSHTLLDSGKRNWKIKGKPGLCGTYDPPILWKMTAADVVAGGRERYCDNVRAWAQSVFEALNLT